jgi:uroporphyrinogen-III synthase
VKTILYLGTDPTHFKQHHLDARVIHYPVIKIVPRSIDDLQIQQAYTNLAEYTHLIFTSKNAVKVFGMHLALMQNTWNVVQDKIVLAIGTVTAAYLTDEGVAPQFVAQEETQEGLIHGLEGMNLSKEAYFFLPRSALSRPVLVNFFQERAIRYHACDLYDTVIQVPHPKPDLKAIDEIVFTSPSTVNAFLQIFGTLPKDKKLFAIGPITKKTLHYILKKVEHQ